MESVNQGICVVCQEIIEMRTSCPTGHLNESRGDSSGDNHFQCFICRTCICSECLEMMKNDNRSLNILRCPICRSLILNNFHVNFKTLYEIGMQSHRSDALIHEIRIALERTTSIIYFALFIRDDNGNLIFPHVVNSYINNEYFVMTPSLQYFRNDLQTSSVGMYLENVEVDFAACEMLTQAIKKHNLFVRPYIDRCFRFGIFSIGELMKFTNDLTSISPSIVEMSFADSEIILPSFESIFTLIFKRFLTHKTMTEYSIFMVDFAFKCPNEVCNGFCKYSVNKYHAVCTECKRFYCRKCRKCVMDLNKFSFESLFSKLSMHFDCDENDLQEVEKIKDKPICRFCGKILERTFDKFVFCDHCNNLYATNSKIFGASNDENPLYAIFDVYTPTIEEMEMINPSIDFWIEHLFALNTQTLRNLLTKFSDGKLVELITEIHSMTKNDKIIEDLSKITYEIYHENIIIVDRSLFKRFIENRKIIRLLLPLMIIYSFESSIINAIISQNIGLLESFVKSFRMLDDYLVE